MKIYLDIDQSRLFLDQNGQHSEKVSVQFCETEQDFENWKEHGEMVCEFNHQLFVKMHVASGELVSIYALNSIAETYSADYLEREKADYEATNYIRLPDAARELGISRQRLAKLIELRGIETINLGEKLKAISPADFETLKNSPRVSGRPRKENPVKQYQIVGLTEVEFNNTIATLITREYSSTDMQNGKHIFVVRLQKDEVTTIANALPAKARIECLEKRDLLQ